ncbi:MerR family transcriptional regulator [Rhodococcus rhodnii]|uniref:MerR family transcriptional regulator n=1 Tax=Rhodococcus rhodnii TaxID=38312 RepID=UPI001EE702C0|nr:MerR family transcriptional regulator [Rhodococcus rhodnii]
MVSTRDAATTLTTADVASAAGCSAQQVRDLEALGVLPSAPRMPNGYRRFTTDHVTALRAYRALAQAVGPVAAREAIRQIRAAPHDEAAATISGFHVMLLDERRRALAARRALDSIGHETATEAETLDADTMSITELSQAVGVRPSTLRFWEREGLVAPQRTVTRSGTARRYGATAVRDVRIVAALRSGGYRIPEARSALDALRRFGDAGRSLDALDARLAEIAERMIALLRAGAILAEISLGAPE